MKEIIVREADGSIEAEIFPDSDYAARKKIRDIPAKLQQLVDAYNSKLPMYKQVRRLKVRDEEFEKTTSRKIKRY